VDTFISMLTFHVVNNKTRYPCMPTQTYMNPCKDLTPLSVDGILKNIQPTNTPMTIASRRNPPNPKGSRIVIQKFLVKRYHICRKMETPGSLTGASGTVEGTVATSDDDPRRERFQAKIKLDTRVVEVSSFSGVRVSTVDISMR
jgi:hypothetical protein